MMIFQSKQGGSTGKFSRPKWWDGMNIVSNGWIFFSMASKTIAVVHTNPCPLTATFSCSWCFILLYESTVAAQCKTPTMLLLSSCEVHASFRRMSVSFKILPSNALRLRTVKSEHSNNTSCYSALIKLEHSIFIFTNYLMPSIPAFQRRYPYGSSKLQNYSAL